MPLLMSRATSSPPSTRPASRKLRSGDTRAERGWRPWSRQSFLIESRPSVVGGLTWLGSSEEEEVSPAISALQRGDWDGFWELFGAPVPEADRLMMEASDPRAMAAVQVGRQRSRYVLDPSRVRASTLLYYGANDTWAPVEAAGEAFGVEPHMLSGRHDHSRAIRDVDAVAPLVLDFLRTAYPVSERS